MVRICLIVCLIISMFSHLGFFCIVIGSSIIWSLKFSYGFQRSQVCTFLSICSNQCILKYIWYQECFKFVQNNVLSWSVTIVNEMNREMCIVIFKFIERRNRSQNASFNISHNKKNYSGKLSRNQYVACVKVLKEIYKNVDYLLYLTALTTRSGSISDVLIESESPNQASS